MKYELTTARQELKRITRHLCIEVPRPLDELELHCLAIVVDAAPRWPRVALTVAVQRLCGGRAYWDERQKEAICATRP